METIVEISKIAYYETIACWWQDILAVWKKKIMDLNSGYQKLHVPSSNFYLCKSSDFLKYLDIVQQFQC